MSTQFHDEHVLYCQEFRARCTCGLEGQCSACLHLKDAARRPDGLGTWLKPRQQPMQDAAAPEQPMNVSQLLEELIAVSYPLRKPSQAPAAAQILGNPAQPEDLGKGMVRFCLAFDPWPVRSPQTICGVFGGIG